MEHTTTIMDADDMRRALRRMSHQIIENTDDIGSIVLVGIKRRGVPMAQGIAACLKEFAGVDAPVGTIDISDYRDDITKKEEAGRLAADIGVVVDGKNIVLTDDVLYTGRSARAAMDALMDSGRPASVRLAVLIDRGHRELPIRADFVGKNVPTSRGQRINVKVPVYDDDEKVELTGQSRTDK